MSAKRKLRTASDVISRLKLSPRSDDETVYIGYDDRINGPMETLLQDYSTIQQGGDLPEHRIWYVRTQNTVLWDRLGRVDKLYGSGNGNDAPVSAETLQHIQAAQVTAVRLEQEKQERRKNKEKERARRARQRAARTALLNPTGVVVATNKSVERFQWIQSPSHRFESNTWVQTTKQSPLKSLEKLKIVTWNVLFDLYDGETDLPSNDRWERLIGELTVTNADVIGLQEVTPNFLSLLLNASYIRENYSVTACPENCKTVSPMGNLLLWKTCLFHNNNLSTYSCVDGGRQRAVLSVLQSNHETFIVSNVHLPANKTDGNRRIARQRELSAILAQTERLQITSTPNTIRVVLGDFNDHDNLFDVSSFTDSWLAISQHDDDGYTFDPFSNKLAERTRQFTKSKETAAKRLDRIYYGCGGGGGISATKGILLGTVVPSSDHFGLAVAFERQTKSVAIDDRNFWAKHAVTTPDTLLALVLGQDLPEEIQFDNRASSLEIPHLTLLHGFVEVSGCLDLIRRTLAQSISSTCLKTNSSPSLLVTQDSVDVFEHASSATLVCRPDTDNPEGQWLTQLYQVLRSVFPQCHTQESRFAEGWTPHVSLGTFGTASAARARAGQIHLAESLNIPIHGITVFERSAIDGKFYARTAVPFSVNKIPRSLTDCNVAPFLKDAGASLNSGFCGLSDTVIREVQRACQVTASTSRLVVYGSHALEASLPGMSDIDMVVKVTGNCTLTPAEFMRHVAEFLQQRHCQAKTRVREASGDSIGTKLRILTIRLWPGAPAVDLQASFRQQDAVFIDAASSLSWSGVLDTDQILSSIPPSHLQAYCGALRIIKLWAYRRHIYGLGYLGGGGYAVWLAKVLLIGLADSSLADKSTLESPQELVAYFFAKASKWPSDPIVVSFSDVNDGAQSPPPLTVLSLSSGNNHGRTATRSTVNVIRLELLRAAQLVCDTRTFHTVVQRLTEALETESFPSDSSISIKVLSIHDEGNADLKAQTGNHLLSLIVDLELRVDDPCVLRPFLRPTRNGNVFVWKLGLAYGIYKELQSDWCERKAKELTASLAPATVTISFVEQSSDFTR